MAFPRPYKLKNFLGEHAPDLPTLGRLRRCNFSFPRAYRYLQILTLRPLMLPNKFAISFLHEITVVCADCLLPLEAVTEVIMASSNINKLSMMISSTSSRDQICQKLLSCLWKRGWCTLAWYFKALRPPPHLPNISCCCLVLIAITHQFSGPKIFT